MIIIEYPVAPPRSTDEAATPDDPTTTTSTSQMASQGSVLLKRFPRQAVSSSWPSMQPATTQLPIQKSNVVAERIRLMARQAESQPKKMATSTTPLANNKTTSASAVASAAASAASGVVVVVQAVSNIVTLYKVNGEAFESCDITGGQRIGQVKSQDPESHTGVITIAPALLSIADNYFLGKTIISFDFVSIFEWKPHRETSLEKRCGNDDCSRSCDGCWTMAIRNDGL